MNYSAASGGELGSFRFKRRNMILASTFKVENTGFPLFLASRSSRRAALLRQMGFEFRIVPVEITEELPSNGDPDETVKTLSMLKARAALPRIKEGLVIGADTVVFLEGKMLGKPANPEDALIMLRGLSGKTHEVFTGFALIDAGDGRTFSGSERTRVTFRNLEEWEIADYVETGMPMDKAGAYGIQDRSGLFVDRIEGCFYNVVGFPLAKFYEGLKKMRGIETVRRMMKSGIRPDLRVGHD
jgi:septum formation protein